MGELGLVMLILVCRFVPKVAELAGVCVLAGLIILIWILKEEMFRK